MPASYWWKAITVSTELLLKAVLIIYPTSTPNLKKSNS
jgi:hypothetical protein